MSIVVIGGSGLNRIGKSKDATCGRCGADHAGPLRLRGDETALSADERAGYELFRAVGCTSCHRGANLGGTMYQRLGLVREYFAHDLGRPMTEADNGRFNVTDKETNRHRFKVPTLRNIALTAPYFHDGSRATLNEAVLAMGRHQLGRDLDAEQVWLVVAFLGALTGKLPEFAPMPDVIVTH